MQGHQNSVAYMQNQSSLYFERGVFEDKFLFKVLKLRITPTFAHEMASKCSLRVFFRTHEEVALF